MPVTVESLKEIFGTEHFTDLLMPCEPFCGHYFCADGGLGAIWDVGGINVDGKTAEDLQAFSHKLQSVFISSSEDVAYQLIVCLWKGAEGITKLFSGNPNVTPAVADYMQRKMKMHQKGVAEGFFMDGNHLFYPSTIKTFVTAKTISGKATKGKVLSKSEWAQDLARLDRLATVLESGFNVNHIPYHRLSPDELIDVMYRLLGPTISTALSAPRYFGGDLRNYMLRVPPSLKEGNWRCDDYIYKVVSFRKNPAFAVQVGGSGEQRTEYRTQANMLFQEMDGVSLYDYFDSFIFTINYYAPNAQRVQSQIDWKRKFTFLNRMNFLGDSAIDKQLIKNDTDKIVTETYSGNKILRAGYHFCFPVKQDDPEAHMRSASVVSFLDRLGCAPVEDDLIGAGIFLRSLPFGYHPNVPGDDVVKRSSTVMASNLADLAPLYRYSRGSKTDVGVIHYNRRGETVLFDLFDPQTAPTAAHCLITGGTGAGKSVTMADFILQSLRQEPYFIIIDKGNSYQRIGEYNNAQYLKFEGIPEVILDPFVIGNRDEDHRAFLVSLLSTMITGGTEAINREEVSILSEVVHDVVSVSGAPSLNAIVSKLRNNEDHLSKSLARKFFPFYGNGQYARFFEGDKPVLNISNRFTVFELGDVEAHKDLQAVIVSQLIHYVTEFVKKLPGVRKYLVIDEAWSLFKNDVAVSFLVKAVKTFRKYGVSVIFLTQQLDDFKVVAEALNMADNCPNQVFLQQKFDVIERMKDTFGLSQGELEMFRSVRKTNRYSEALIKTQEWSSVIRIMLDPKGYWLTTTKDSDKAYLAELMREMSLPEAVDKAALTYPRGKAA